MELDVYNGILSKNPYQWEAFNVTQFEFFLNGEPVQTFKPNYETGAFLEVYQVSSKLYH